MDELDKKILTLLNKNARATVKEIAGEVALTSPAVSERIRRMEKNGIIEGYTVRFNPQLTQGHINALISISVPPKDRPEFIRLLAEQPAVQQCFQVTGGYSYMVKVRCRDVAALEVLLSHLQKMGQTNTQIILSTIEGNGIEF
ncbi:Lrp/AsnC family transcriptional regulator [Ruminococcaceae bacterium OttesenSCG-928-A16]|nr:Lrp/AsnC family transcriptional regulator [Ruminococcaceae bacterium OttesenSCG-928-A16]